MSSESVMFQFLTGSIDRKNAVNSTPAQQLFQFLTGSIDSLLLGFLTSPLFGFNSLQVQLIVNFYCFHV